MAFARNARLNSGPCEPRGEPMPPPRSQIGLTVRDLELFCTSIPPVQEDRTEVSKETNDALRMSIQSTLDDVNALIDLHEEFNQDRYSLPPRTLNALKDLQNQQTDVTSNVFLPFLHQKHLMNDAEFQLLSNGGRESEKTGSGKEENAFDVFVKRLKEEEKCLRHSILAVRLLYQQSPLQTTYPPTPIQNHKISEISEHQDINDPTTIKFYFVAVEKEIEAINEDVHGVTLVKEKLIRVIKNSSEKIANFLQSKSEHCTSMEAKVMVLLCNQLQDIDEASINGAGSDKALDSKEKFYAGTSVKGTLVKRYRISNKRKPVPEISRDTLNIMEVEEGIFLIEELEAEDQHQGNHQLVDVLVKFLEEQTESTELTHPSPLENEVMDLFIFSKGGADCFVFIEHLETMKLQVMEALTESLKFGLKCMEARFTKVAVKWVKKAHDLSDTKFAIKLLLLFEHINAGYQGSATPFDDFCKWYGKDDDSIHQTCTAFSALLLT